MGKGNKPAFIFEAITKHAAVGLKKGETLLG